MAVSMFAMRYAWRMWNGSRQVTKKEQENRKQLLRKLNVKQLETNKYEDIVAGEAVNPNDITVSFEDVGGQAELKKSIQQLVILPFQRPKLFTRGSLLRPPKGILLYGPPGTGKTMLAKAIAKETKAIFLNISASLVMDKWFGESQKLVKAIFTLAWKVQPCIIFIDEIDAFLRSRSSGDNEAWGNMKAEFMTLWDGLSTNENARVIVIGATNRPWDVDAAILRRLPRTFLIDLPDVAQREAILRVMLQSEPVEPGFSFPNLAELTERYSGSDLHELCKAASMKPVFEYVDCAEPHDLPEGVAEERCGSCQVRRGAGGASGDVTAGDLRGLLLADFVAATNEVTPTGEVAAQYFERVGGLSVDEVKRALR